ncbi:hypothetical protein N2152v2_000733 [Parachlorella kessleri]
MTVLSEAEVRAGLLIEILQEEAEEQGLEVPEPPAGARTWAESAIREYFKSCGKVLPAKAARIAPADPAVFAKWFPGLELSKTACAQPRLRVLCFPNAGSAEDMYTSEGTGVRKAPSPLLDWCRANSAECLAVQPPGRNGRAKEAFITTAQELGQQVLQVVGSKLYDVPYVIVGHSVGTWVAYEFLCAARQQGLPMPRHAFLSGFASPDLPEVQRPWRQQRLLGEQDFKDECREWDVNEIVFSNAMWGMYQPIMRADFTIFDEYCFTHQGECRFTFPVTTFYGTRDRKIQQWMVEGWQKFTAGPFICHRVEGNHLWPLDKDAKKGWLQTIADEVVSLEL